MLHILSLCVCSLRYPACIMLSSLTCSASRYFPHYLINGTFFEEKKLLKKRVFWFLYNLVWNISHSEKKTERDMINICIGLQENNALFLSDFNKTWLFSTYFRKVLKYKISWESVQWEMSCSMRMDGHIDERTDMVTPTVSFRNFAKSD